METLRIPKGLWEDLETSVIAQDRQFLIEVARSLGLPVQEVLRKCIRPVPTSVPVLWYTNTVDQCPWYSARGSLWFPCVRQRLSATLPCCVHERPGDYLHKSDPLILGATQWISVRRKNIIYWVDPTGKEAPLTEDGRPVTEGTFRLSTFRGKKIALWTASN